VVTQAYRIG